VGFLILLDYPLTWFCNYSDAFFSFKKWEWSRKNFFHHRDSEGTEMLFFSFAGLQARLCKSLKRGGPLRQTKTISPIGQLVCHFKATAYLLPLFRPRRAVFFLPIVVCPPSRVAQGRRAGIPMGKKGKTLCGRACRAVALAEAGASVVKYPM
jgi:hypothetical protein